MLKTPEELLKAEYQRVTGEPCEDMSKVTAKMTLAAFAAYADQYKQLLGKYIQHVKNCEGVDYINNGADSPEREFTPEEFSLLIRLAGKPTF